MRKNTDLKKEVKYYKWKMRQRKKYGKIEKEKGNNGRNVIESDGELK